MFKVGRRLRAKNDAFELENTISKITQVLENKQVFIEGLVQSIEYEDIIKNFDIL